MDFDCQLIFTHACFMVLSLLILKDKYFFREILRTRPCALYIFIVLWDVPFSLLQGDLMIGPLMAGKLQLKGRLNQVLSKRFLKVVFFWKSVSLFPGKTKYRSRQHGEKNPSQLAQAEIKYFRRVCQNTALGLISRRTSESDCGSCVTQQFCAEWLQTMRVFYLRHCKCPNTYLKNAQLRL